MFVLPLINVSRTQIIKTTVVILLLIVNPSLFSLFLRRAKTYNIEFRSCMYLFSPQFYHLILQDVCRRRPEIGNSWIGNHYKIRSLCVYETRKTETWCHVGKGWCPKRYIEFSIPRAYRRNETLEPTCTRYQDTLI